MKIKFGDIVSGIEEDSEELVESKKKVKKKIKLTK
jgi:hypothetical protein